MYLGEVLKDYSYDARYNDLLCKGKEFVRMIMIHVDMSVRCWVSKQGTWGSTRLVAVVVSD